MIYRFSFSLNVLLIFVICICLSISSFAQYNFHKYSFGIGTGVTLPFADTKKANYSFANQISAEYSFTPYITTGLELQFGNMRGGERDKDHFTNSFTLISWSSKMQLGQFYDRFDQKSGFYWFIRGFYAGVGFGFIRNNVLAVKDGVGFKNLNHDVIFPFHGGANFYFPDFYGRDRWELNFNMQFVAAMGDAMDGDLNPKSKHNDVYNYFSTGVRYKFGTLGLDKRKGRIK